MCRLNIYLCLHTKVKLLLYCRTRGYSAAENRCCSEEFPHNSASVCLFLVDRGADVGMHKTHLPHDLSLPAFSVEKQETPDEEADAWQIVVSVQFCQAICGQYTVLSSNLWSVYSYVKQFVVNVQFSKATWSVCSSVKQFVVTVQFCRVICGQCTVLSSKLWSVYSSVKQIVASVQSCQAICGQFTVLSNNLWSVYSSVKQLVVSVQFCQANCGQCTVL